MTAEQRVLSWLERADFTGNGCRHSQETIAMAVGCSRRTVIRAVQTLSADGRVRVEKERRPGCKWPNNVYHVRDRNPQKRSGVLNVLASIRRRREAECHTERTADLPRVQTPCRDHSPRRQTKCQDVAREARSNERTQMSQEIPREALQSLHVLLARYFAAETDLNFAARPWLVGELPAPMAQLHDMVERLRVLDELGAELRGECRAVYRLIQAERERNGTAEVKR